jgi:hypothetical protein
MGLPWVRLDTQWPHNPKFLMLAEDKKWRAIVVYMAALGYAGVHGTDGFIPVVALPMLHATKKEAHELAEGGLWMPTQGGWDINGWAEFQPSQEDAQARRDKAKKAAQARWAKDATKGNVRAV